MNLELTDKVAIVTGASRGLGFGAARALVEEGCRVAVCARGAEALHASAASLAEAAGRGDAVLSIVADVSLREGAERVVAETVERWGRLDVLVNNVGRAGGAGIVDTEEAVWQEALDQTLFPAIRMSRLAVPQMRLVGGGAILIIASIYGRESGGRMAYNVVKSAEISLAKAMAAELAADNIRVNSIAPGSMVFEGGSWWKRQQSDPKGIADFVRREIPMGRFGRPDELGAVVAFLASPRASWVTGASIPVDGGQGRSNI